MRKRFSGIVSLCMIFCVLLTGCNTANAGDGSSQAELHSTAASQENTEWSSNREEKLCLRTHIRCRKYGFRMAT